jgi:hypothetical protein
VGGSDGLHFFKLVFADAAYGTRPVCGEVFESDVAVCGGVVDVAADLAYVFFHLVDPFFSVFDSAIIIDYPPWCNCDIMVA